METPSSADARSGGCRSDTPAGESRAGLRTVSLPGLVVKELKRHLCAYVDPEPSAFVFTGPVVESMGKVGLHFHDLRTATPWRLSPARARVT
jgi:hypothetical protein